MSHTPVRISPNPSTWPTGGHVPRAAYTYANPASGSTLMSMPAAVGGSRADATFHRAVAAQDTNTPSTTEAATNRSTSPSVRPAGAVSTPVAAATGSASRVTAPVPTPTTVDQP